MDNYQEINEKNILKWEESLKYLINILDENSIRYFLSASGLHYVMGGKIYPYDIDLFMTEKDVKKAYGLLKKYATTGLHLFEEKYLEFQGMYNNIPFEICEWEKKPEELEKLKYKDFEISIIK